MEKQHLLKILHLRSETQKVGVTTDTFKEYDVTMKPILRWIYYSRSVIKAYYKTLELQLN